MGLETGVFWYGDNLDVMRDDLTSDGEVDLIYLDPPFNSGAGYNMFFREADKSISQAQRRIFEDYWTWGKESQNAFDECVAPRRKYLVSAAFIETMQALSRIIPGSDMLARRLRPRRISAGSAAHSAATRAPDGK
jgi:hypothetical protein